jgi:amino acid adenylation domain-containing protein/non-ribosomal peptide synthase protein (TIGR01720 family)
LSEQLKSTAGAPLNPESGAYLRAAKPHAALPCSEFAISNRRNQTLIDLLNIRADELAGTIAYTTLDERGQERNSVTFRDLSLRARAVAARLQQMDLKQKRAVLLYPAGLDYVAAFFGCLCAGVVAIPAFPPRHNRKNERLAAIVDDAAPALALTLSSLKRRTEACLSEICGERGILVESTDDVPVETAAVFEQIRANPDDLAYLQYTSGSTAAPRGVMITHKNVLSNLAYINEGFEHDSSSVSLTWLPHFHDMGLVDGILMPLFRGFRGILMPSAAFLQRPITWLRALTEYKVTHSGGPDFAYDLCVRKITDEQRRELDLRSWAVAYNGAEPIHPDVLDRFADAFHPCGFRRSAFYPAYGLAEATLKVSGGRRNDAPIYCVVDSDALEHNKVSVGPTDPNRARTLVGCGVVAYNTTVLIVDPESRTEREPGSVGEIWVSGPGVAQGFWDRPEETEQVLRAYTSDTARGPFLRTGDLGFILYNELYVTGRLKDLIIIRGRNVYPQDIEATASRSHPALRPGGGAAFSLDGAGGERLVVVHELESRKDRRTDEIISAIRQAVSEDHDVNVEEIVLLRPGSLPRTSSGKTQRKLCRQLFLSRELEAVGEWSLDPSSVAEFPEDEASDIQIVVQRVIARKLRIPAAGIQLDEPISRYGLDSLASIEIAHEIETRFKTPISMAELLAETTISQIAERISETTFYASEGSRFDAETPSREAEYPLSQGQLAIWFIYQMDPLSAAYNMAGAVRITSELDVESLRQAFQALVDRHESLRVTFGSRNGIAYQRVSSEAKVSFDVRDVSGCSDDVLKTEVEAAARRPFDLENGPVFRVNLYRIGDDQHVLLMVVHHIVADFWSLAVMMDELGKSYQVSSAGLDVPRASYAQYVRRQERALAGAPGEDDWTYWRKQLAGDLPSLALPLDRERPRLQTYRGSSLGFATGTDVLDRARSVANANKTTLFVTLLTAFQTLLARYCGQDEILVGTPTAGRTSHEFSEVVGYFVNPVVIRSIVAPADSFLDRVEQVREKVIEAFYHQDYPFSQIVKRLSAGRDPSRSPIFQTMFALQKSHLDDTGALAAISLGDPGAVTQFGRLELRAFPVDQRIAQFDVTLTVAETAAGVWGAFEYNTDLLEAATIERMRSRFLTLLDALASDPFAPVANVSYITEAERHQLLDEYSDNSGDAFCFVPVHREFEEQAASIPDAVAVVEGDSILTYGELNARANKLCGYLRTAGVESESAVVLLVSRSLDMVVALMAVLKSGGAYVPLDPEAPASRIGAIIKDVQPVVVLADSGLAAKVADCGAATFLIDGDWRTLTDDSAGGSAPVEGDELCYIIYTSGSSGVPKGVAVRHSSLARFVQATRTCYGTTRHDRVLQFASLSFDASAEEIFVPLVSGASIVIHTDQATTSSTALIRECRERIITHLSLPTAYWHAIASDLTSAEWDSAPAVRLAVIGGENALTDRMDDWCAGAAHRIRLFNSYGPTETTIAATLWSAREGEEVRGPRLPIGRPLSGSYAYTLDVHGHPVPVGLVGEICIGGDGVARGYFDDPAKTAERFVPDPFGKRSGCRVYRSGDLGRFTEDGNLECLGRLDRQVKVRGFRIELEEVEAALNRIPEVKSAAVSAPDEGNGARRLVAYVVLQEGVCDGVRLLRSALGDKLPPFMVPSHFVFLDELPTNAAGKVDRPSLPPVPVETASVSSREGGDGSDLERRIAAIWAQILGVARVGLDDNFFEIGGDSILVLQVVARARRQEIAITPRQLFENPTVSGLTLVASSASGEQAEQEAMGGSAPLTPIQRWFFECGFEAAHHWNMALMLELTEKVGFEVIADALSSMAAQHAVLRSTFIREDGEWRQRLGSGRPPSVRAVDLTATGIGEENQEIQSVVASEQAGLDLTDGPMLRAVLFRTGSNRPDRLMIVVHHLVSDAVSLSILVEQLDRACRITIDGDDSGAPSASVAETSVAAWASELERLAHSPAILHEIQYWRKLKDARFSVLPVDNAGDNLEGATATAERCLSASQTVDLIRIAREPYLAKVDELLIAALAEVLCDWTGGSSALIEVERHGREVPAIEMDVSRSLGWFTVTFPLLIDLVSAPGHLNAVHSVRRSLREVPGGGTGFGLLRYVCGDENVRAEMRELPRAQVSFNYLGDLDRSFETARYFCRPEILTSGLRSPRAARSHLLEIDSAIRGHRLQLAFRFSTGVFKAETIERLADSVVSRLEGLIEQGLTEKPAASYSTSDFPLAKLNQAQLDRLAGPARTVQDIYPLTPSQQGMLFHAIYSHDGDVYAGTLLVSIRGKLDQEAFEQSWRQIIQRHAIFRTSFEWEGLPEPLQIVHRNADLPVRRLDLRGRREGDALGVLKDLAAEELKLRFDLHAAPLMRITLAQTSGEHHYLLLSLHHLLIDGWSISLVFDEVFNAYGNRRNGGGPAEPTPPSRSFGAYVAWVNSQDRDAPERFWRKEVEGISSPASLPILEQNANRTVDKRSSRRVVLSAYVTSRLASFARQNQITLNTAVQGAWGALLSRYTGDADVLFGSVSSGRPAALTGAQEIVGPFAATFPTRIRLSGGASLIVWLKKLQDDQMQARQFEYCSLIDIQGWSEIPRGRPMFETILAFENYPLDTRKIGSLSGLDLGLIESIESTNYPLTVIVVPGDHLALQIVYHSDRVKEAAIDRLCGHVEVLLSSLPDYGDRTASCLPILSGAERAQILGNWSGTPTDYPRDRSIADLFREQADRLPDSIAVVYGTHQITYAELDRRSARVGNWLARKGIGRESVVGISTERSVEMIVSLLAIARAGAAYLPVDLSYPEDRVRFILTDSGAGLLLVPASTGTGSQDSGFTIISIEEIMALSEDRDAASLWAGVESDNLAYAIYTSGSTGGPKGVAVTNRGVVRLVKRTNYFDFGEHEVFLQSSTLSFDASTFEIWGALLNGARLVIMPPGTPTLAEIGSAVRQHQVTAAWFTAGLFHLLVQDRVEDIASIGSVLAGGDVVALADADSWAARSNRGALINGYGPTEGTTFTACYRCEPGSVGNVRVPIGRPISNTIVHILDDHMNPLPERIPGELYIGGDGLARGYVGAAGLTAERFIPNPLAASVGERLYRSGDLGRFLPDGDIEFLGRRDGQVKIRGFRIEPEEVESVLARHPEIRQSAVLAHGESSSDRRLVAYIAAVPGKHLDAALIREFLSTKIPEYMVPNEFLMMEQLPLTANGKVDRRNLPAAGGWARSSIAEHVVARNAVEDVLAGIWEESLGESRIGVLDDFFALGGHSLTAIRVISAIRYIFKVDLTVSKLFESPTIEGLARELIAVEPKPGQMNKIARVVQRIKGMSPEERVEKLRSGAQHSV